MMSSAPPSIGSTNGRQIAKLGLVAMLPVLLLSATALARSISSPPAMTTGAADPSHPLALKYVETRLPRSMLSLADDPERLVSAAARGGIFLFGEVHDNPDHHALQGWLAWNTASLRRQTGNNQTGSVSAPAVVFEQLRTDQQPAIDAFLSLPPTQRTLEAFLQAIEWEKSGWSKYDYRPLFEKVLKAELPILAGDPPRDLIRKAAKEGASAMAPDEQKRLVLDVRLDEMQHDAALAELEESHCGAMPKSALGGMAFAQRYRDATLADVALKALELHGAVIIIAGNGHVRSDRGIPWYVRKRAPVVPVAVTMLLEVIDGQTDPEAYLPRDPDGKPAADVVIFTPRAVRDDPCKAFSGAPIAPKN